MKNCRIIAFSSLFIFHSSLAKGKYQSGQMGQTVNLLAYAFGGSNPSLPTNCGSSSVDRALAFQAEGRGFESRLNCGSSSVDRALAFQAEGRGFESRLPLCAERDCPMGQSLFLCRPHFLNGGFATFILNLRPRLSSQISVPGLECSVFTYPSPIPIFRVGDIVPEVTCPISSPSLSSNLYP